MTDPHHAPSKPRAGRAALQSRTPAASRGARRSRHLSSAAPRLPTSHATHSAPKTGAIPSAATGSRSGQRDLRKSWRPADPATLPVRTEQQRTDHSRRFWWADGGRGRRAVAHQNGLHQRRRRLRGPAGPYGAKPRPFRRGKGVDAGRSTRDNRHRVGLLSPLRKRGSP